MRNENMKITPSSLSVTAMPMHISPEISNAIRRQHGTEGVEYRPIISSSQKVASRSPRRVSLSNIFFPNYLDMNGNSMNSNFKRAFKGRSFGTDVKPSGLWTVYPQTKVDSSHLGNSKLSFTKQKDALLTDLSALSMDDTHVPQPVTQNSHFYELCHAKVRYIDFLEDVVTYRTDPNVKKSRDISVGIPMERMHTFAIRRPSVRLNSQSRSSSLSTIPVMPLQTIRQTDHKTSFTKTKPPIRQQEYFVSNGDFISRKPTLKQTSDSNGHGRYLKTVAGDLAVKGKVYSGRTEKNKKLVPNDLTLYHRNIRSSSMPVIVTKNSSERSKKRGVHFSVCNEVFEYVPSAPVGQHD